MGCMELAGTGWFSAIDKNFPNRETKLVWLCVPRTYVLGYFCDAPSGLGLVGFFGCLIAGFE
jgi:hypothetical protein